MNNEYVFVRGFVKNISAVPSKGTEDTNNYIVEIELLEGLRITYNKELPYQPEIQASRYYNGRYILTGQILYTYSQNMDGRNAIKYKYKLTHKSR